jgi:hypothetical protein
MKSEIFPHKDIPLVSITIKNTLTEDKRMCSCMGPYHTWKRAACGEILKYRDLNPKISMTVGVN